MRKVFSTYTNPVLPVIILNSAVLKVSFSVSIPGSLNLISGAGNLSNI